MNRYESRRGFIRMLTSFAGAALLRPTHLLAASGRGYRAVAFDGFALFDPRPIAALAARLFPGKGDQLVELWRVKQLDYQWLRALSGRYQDFWQTTESALVFAARALGLDLTGELRDRLMRAWLQLKAWPDVAPSLRKLREARLRLAPLANLTPHILDSAIVTSGLEGAFDEVISTDRARTFKPDPRAYQLGVEVLRLRREEIVFVASAGWDASGASWFGYPTFWLNRAGAPAEELHAGLAGTGREMADLLAFLASTK